VGVPLDYVPIILAERFGGGPLLYREMPADDRAWLLGMLAEEARIESFYSDLGPDDEVVFPEDWEDD
jgi:hypothetical protein